MVTQVAPRHPPERFLDHDLDRLLDFWRTVPEQAAEWPQCDDDSRLDFILEWPIMRGAMWRIAAAANAGLLDERQQRRWTELNRLIESHRATVEQMLGESI
jgi:hypothetical protein